MQGFFQPDVIASSPEITADSVPRCGSCKLHERCNSPKMQPTGSGRKKILVVAEAPGEREDELGTQLVGKSGQFFRETLSELGIDLNRDCWKTNAIICHPEGNRTPTSDELSYCLPNLLKTIQQHEPVCIILLGAAATSSLIGKLWKTGVGSVTRWAGWCIPSQELNAWICPTYHPAYLLRNQNDKPLNLWFRRHLAAAVKKTTRPWDVLPDYDSQVEVEFDSKRTARILRKMIERGGTVSFDYETDRLKPDAPDSKIISCAVCWNGKKTIAYPFVGEAVRATSELLRSGLGKIGANIKFEERWTRAVLRHGVRNWLWDTVQVAHVLDNRKAISSVKFQAFVRLGYPAYDEHIKPYLQADSGRAPNRIKELGLESILKYNGLDALLEYEIAQCQMRDYGEIE